MSWGTFAAPRNTRGRNRSKREVSDTNSNFGGNALRSLLKLSLLVLVLLAYGCGGETIINSTSAPAPPEVATGNVLVKFDLQQRVVPTSVVSFRFTGFSADGAVVFGPKTFDKASEILLEGVPVTTTRLGIELLVGDIVVGIASVPVTVTEGATFVVENVDFSTVTPDAALAIDPPTAVLALGQQGAWTVISDPNEPTPVDVTSQATLTSSDPTVLRVDGPGLATGISAGSATLTATFNGQTATSEVTVTSAVIASVALSPTTTRVLGEFQFRLIGTFSDGKTTDLTNVADWSSDAEGVLTVGDEGLQSGLATTVSLGSATVMATYNGLSASQAVTTVGGARLLSFNGTNTAEGNDDSFSDNNILQNTFSADGRFAVFTSDADDLLPAGSPIVDGNATNDIYVRDRQTNTNILVSVDVTGLNAGNSFSSEPVISRDGRFVVFRSQASDLTAVAPPAGTSQIYRRDLLAGTTELVSLNGDAVPVAASDSCFSPSISRDGNVVVFETIAANFPTTGSGALDRLIWRNLATGEVRLVNLDPAGNFVDQNGLYSLNQDGRFVAFTAYQPPAPNQPFGSQIILLRDTEQATTVEVSVDEAGTSLTLAEAPLLNADASHILFFAFGGGQFRAGTYDKNLATGTLTLVSSILGTGVSDDGRYLVGISADSFLFGLGSPTLQDLQTGALVRLEVQSDGLFAPSFGFFAQAPSISGDGSVTSFTSEIPLDTVVTGTDAQVYEVSNPLLP